MLAPWTRPTKARDAAGTISTGTRPSSGASGRGSELATTPRSLSVATCQPRSSAPAEVITTATTSPRAPTLVRSNRRIRAIVANPITAVCRSIWPGFTNVLKVRTMRFAPSAS